MGNMGRERGKREAKQPGCSGCPLGCGPAPHTPDLLQAVAFSCMALPGWVGSGWVDMEKMNTSAWVGEVSVGRKDNRAGRAALSVFPRALGPDGCEGVLRASTARILHTNMNSRACWLEPGSCCWFGLLFTPLSLTLLPHTRGTAVAGSEIETLQEGLRTSPVVFKVWL